MTTTSKGSWGDNVDWFVEVSDMAKISFWLRIIAASLAALVVSTSLSGCSSIKFGYNQLPEISSWWLDNYANFNDKQAADTKVALKSLQSWHRKEELTPLANLLLQTQGMASKNITPEQACDLWDQTEKRLDALATETARLALPIVLQLTPRQMQHLEKKWREKNEDWKKEWLEPKAEERLKKRVTSTVNRYSDFYGKLSEAQVKLLSQQAQQSKWDPERALQTRIKRQQTQLQTLQDLVQASAKPDFSMAAAEKTLYHLMTMGMRPQDPLLMQQQTQLEKQACENFAQFHNSTTASQRQKAQRQLKSYETDLRDLI
jgi:hypothetical protein